MSIKEKFNKWLEESRKKNEQISSLVRLKDDKKRFEFYKRTLLSAYNESKRYENNRVLVLRWHDYSIPVDAEYLRDILGYSEGTCKNVLMAIEHDIDEIENNI